MKFNIVTVHVVVGWTFKPRLVILTSQTIKARFEVKQFGLDFSRAVHYRDEIWIVEYIAKRTARMVQNIITRSDFLGEICFQFVLGKLILLINTIMKGTHCMWTRNH